MPVVGTGITEVALQKAAGLDKAAPVKPEGENGKFADMLQQTQQFNQKVMESFGFGDNKGPDFKAISAPQATGPIDPNGIQTISSREKIMGVLSDVNRGQLQLDNIMEVVHSGRRFAPSELLALQAGVFQIGLELEMTGKTVEVGNNSFKTIWNTNLQG